MEDVLRMVEGKLKSRSCQNRDIEAGVCLGIEMCLNLDKNFREG